MGGAQPRRMTVISPAIGPVWAVHLMAPSLPTAALPRPWWLLQTRQAIAWRALASAREVCVWRPAIHCWPGTSTSGRWFVPFCSDSSSCHPLAFTPIMLAWDFLSAACGCCAQDVHGTCCLWLYKDIFLTLTLTQLLYNSPDFAHWFSWVKWITGWCVILASFYRHLPEHSIL